MKYSKKMGGQLGKQNVISFLSGSLEHLYPNYIIIHPLIIIKSHVVNWSTTFPLRLSIPLAVICNSWIASMFCPEEMCTTGTAVC